MLKVDALPPKKSPFEDFILSENIAVDNLSLSLLNEIQDGEISKDGSSIAHLIENQLAFFIHQGSNNYSDLSILSSRAKPGDRNEFTPSSN